MKDESPPRTLPQETIRKTHLKDLKHHLKMTLKTLNRATPFTKLAGLMPFVPGPQSMKRGNIAMVPMESLGLVGFL